MSWDRYLWKETTSHLHQLMDFNKVQLNLSYTHRFFLFSRPLSDMEQLREMNPI